MNSQHDIDLDKRMALATFSRFGAAITLASASSLTAASVFVTDTDPSVLLQKELEITIVSSPDVAENSLIVKNISEHIVVINSFHVGDVIFDGDTIDCNEICTDQPVLLLPDQERVFWIDQLNAKSRSTLSVEPLDAQSATEYLPQGTRIVTLNAQIIENLAYLSSN